MFTFSPSSLTYTPPPSSPAATRPLIMPSATEQIKDANNEAKLKEMFANIPPAALRLEDLHSTVRNLIENSRDWNYRAFNKSSLWVIIRDWNQTAGSAEKPPLELYLACRASHKSLNHQKNDKFSVIIAARGLDQWAGEELNRLILAQEEAGASGFEDDDEENQENHDHTSEESATGGVPALIARAAGATATANDSTSHPEQSQTVKREITSESSRDFEFQGIPELPPAPTGTAEGKRGVSSKRQAVSQPGGAELIPVASFEAVMRELEDLKRRLPVASVETSPSNKRIKTVVLHSTGTQTASVRSGGRYKSSGAQTEPQPQRKQHHKTPVAGPSTSPTIDLAGTTRVPHTFHFKPEDPINTEAFIKTEPVTQQPADSSAMHAQIENAVGAAFARHSDHFQASMRDFCINTVRGMADEVIYQQQQRFSGRSGMSGFGGGAAAVGPLTTVPRPRQRAMPSAQIPDGRGFGGIGGGVGGAGMVPEWDQEYDEMIDMRNFGGRSYNWR